MSHTKTSAGERQETGAPGERPAVSTVVAEMTDGGREVVRFLMAVMKGRIKTAKVADRMKAATELLDRGYGRPRPAGASSDADSDSRGPSISMLGGEGQWPMETDYDD